MKVRINEYGKEEYDDVKAEDVFSKELFHDVAYETTRDNNKQWAFHSNLGSLTVLNRMTGWGNGVRDTETGYRSPDGKFWLASGGYDVRESGCKTIGEAIDWVKRYSNSCVGV